MSCDDRESEKINDPPILLELIEISNVKIDESNENVSKLDLLQDHLFNDLKIKPLHWSEEYWQTITSTYEWFLHKDGMGGCYICLANKVFMGKKSLLATMKLKLLDLSYSDFEKKLLDHSKTTQHIKSTVLYSKFDLNHKIQDVSTVNSISNDYPCPICNKQYKMKKALIKHIYSCNVMDNSRKFQSPCDCEKYFLHSIKALDDHNQEIHFCKFNFTCHICYEQFNEATNIYGHYLNDHNYQWNPLTFMPEVVVGQTTVSKNQMQSTSRADRKKSNIKKDDIWYMYDTEGDNIIPNETNNVKRRKTYKDDDDYDYTTKSVNSKNDFSNKSEMLPVYKTEHSINKSNYEPISMVGRVINTSELDPFNSILRTPSLNKIELVTNNDKNETPNLMFSFEQIHICEYCGGRYLSANILQEHVSTRHLCAANSVESDDENLMRKYRKKLTVISESLINHRQNVDFDKSPTKLHNMKRKSNDQLDINCPDNTISHCLLTCPMCQESFTNLEDRNKHVSQNHPEIEQFICHQCGLIFNNHSNYNKHLEKSHNNLISKVPKNSDVLTYCCTICPLVFTNTADLTHHINLSHPESVDITPSLNTDIDEELQKVTELALDSNIQNTETIVNVESDPVLKSEQYLTNLIEADAKENSSHCSKCDLVLHNPFELVVHNLTHCENDEDIDIPTCPNCNRLFFGEFGKIYLKDHYNVDHLKKLAPQCIICNIFLPSSFALEKHHVNGFCQDGVFNDPYQPLMEENKMAFSCSQCGLIFAGENSNLRLEVHNKSCASDLLDADEFLDS